MGQQLINTPEDMEWLREVHLPHLPKVYRSAVIHGNEDWPTRIEAYIAKNPNINDKPVVYTPDTDGKYRRLSDGKLGCGSDCGCSTCKNTGLLGGLMLGGCGCPVPKVEQVQGLGADYRTGHFYVSTYCNFGHDTKTGRPIDHECIIIPPKALRAEMNDNISEAIEIIAAARKAGKLRVVQGRKMKNEPIGGFSPEGCALLTAGVIGIGLFALAKS